MLEKTEPWNMSKPQQEKTCIVEHYELNHSTGIRVFKKWGSVDYIYHFTTKYLCAMFLNIFIISTQMPMEVNEK